MTFGSPPLALHALVQRSLIGQTSSTSRTFGWLAVIISIGRAMWLRSQGERPARMPTRPRAKSGTVKRSFVFGAPRRNDGTVTVTDSLSPPVERAAPA
jgi:hypothetical protein